MQKFRFLLPLFILTFIVVAVSYGVRQYASNHAMTTNTQTNQPSDSEDTNSEDLNNSSGQETQSGGFLARIFGTKKSSSSSQPVSPTTTPKPMPSPVSTSFSQTEVSVPINEERDIFIALDTDTNPPTAYTFNMSFDPKSINIVKVEPGDIWQQSTIFTKANTIDNSKGTLSYSAGQSLGTQKGAGKTLIKISIKAKSTTQTGSELKIDDSSKFAYVGLDYAIPLKSKSIEIHVTK